ncbi:uncharacterized protein [Erythrolamprus reginae]|uniref:uncharacterized protein n=1 Tax=Erythrolamprus reginae TaxID=121349 RepID=UPI00396C60B3
MQRGSENGAPPQSIQFALKDVERKCRASCISQGHSVVVKPLVALRCSRPIADSAQASQVLELKLATRRQIAGRWTAGNVGLLKLQQEIYVSQEATVRTGHRTTDQFKIGKGVRQGCKLSPSLFNFYAEHIMRKAGLDESQVGIKIARRNINNLRYADDTTLMAESEEGLKRFLMRVKKENTKVGWNLNIKKSKIMATSPLNSWQVDGGSDRFYFLGSKITIHWDCSQQIKRRLLLGRKVKANLDSILKSRDITLPTKVCIIKAMVFSVAKYGCESWTIRKAEHQRIELWCWRRLMQVPWTVRQ